MDDAPDLRRAQRLAIIMQCVGCLPMLAYGNGFMLSLFGRLGLDGEEALRLISLPNLIAAIATVPLAYWSDRHGSRVIGTIGMSIYVAASLGLLVVAWIGTPGLIGPIIVCEAIGAACLSACWFPLLDPLVPPEQRGRFFARLRMSWQTVGILGGFTIAALLQDGEINSYLVILAAFPVLHLLRVGIFRRIPDRTTRPPAGTTLLGTLARAVTQPGYLGFGSYLFLLRLAVGAIPWIFGLLQQRVHAMPAADVVLLANLVAVGTLAGYWIGGRLVDRYGAKPVFLIAHVGYGVAALLVLQRDLFPVPVFAVFAGAALMWGAVDACSGIAVTTEMLALTPAQGKALTISLLNTLSAAGIWLSAWAGSAAISAGLFADGWHFLGQRMSAYDGVLAVGCFLVLTFVVTLGLVPSIVRRRQDLP